ncbi:MAG TPA: hypothetical protein VFF94_06795, partial [Novosphingobium sp.]|nr:hypothetical protein [Novosphingobium sp.]
MSRALLPLRRAAARLVPVLALLGLWQLVAGLGLVPPQVLAPPARVAATLAGMAASGELARHLGDSLHRLLLGFALGAVAGLAFGAATALSRWVQAALWPLFLALWQVPVIAFIPVLVLFLG